MLNQGIHGLVLSIFGFFLQVQYLFYPIFPYMSPNLYERHVVIHKTDLYMLNHVGNFRDMNMADVLFV